MYTAYLGFIPERKLGVAVLANGSGYPTAQMAQVALGIALGVEQLPFLRLEEALEAITGIYTTYRDGIQVSVRPKGGGLELIVEDREAPKGCRWRWQISGRIPSRVWLNLGNGDFPSVSGQKKLGWSSSTNATSYPAVPPSLIRDPQGE